MKPFLTAAALVTFGLVMLPSAPPALACSCLPITQEEALKKADVAFKGVVIGRTPSSTSLITWTFKVDTVLKGKVKVGKRVRVTSPESSAACGAYFKVGSRYQVYAYYTEGRLQTSLCSGNKQLKNLGNRQSISSCVNVAFQP